MDFIVIMNKLLQHLHICQTCHIIFGAVLLLGKDNTFTANRRGKKVHLDEILGLAFKQIRWRPAGDCRFGISVVTSPCHMRFSKTSARCSWFKWNLSQLNLHQQLHQLWPQPPNHFPEGGRKERPVWRAQWKWEIHARCRDSRWTLRRGGYLSNHRCQSETLVSLTGTCGQIYII